MTLVIYDNEGFIISQMQGSSLREPIGVPFLWVDVPEGKYIKGVDVSERTHVPVFGNLQKSETQLMQEQINDLNVALAALMGGAV
ncbi:MAG TPA: hypothetical protein VHP38_05410 [Ruminiclostridium sp.]|nr:hypothetical protein [Ruminiclostridium sp.]